MEFQDLFQNARCVSCLRAKEVAKTMNHGTPPRCAQHSAVAQRQTLTTIDSQLAAGTLLHKPFTEMSQMRSE